MKPNQLITTLLAATALFVASCSTPKMAQNNAIQDDVYNTTARAKEYIAPIIVENTSTENVNDPNYRQSDPYYDMDYSSRIDRFYYGNPNRAYYDPYYNYYGYNSYGYNSFGYNPYRYNSFYNPYNNGFGLNGYFGSYYNNWNNPYNNWSYYGTPYYNNFWGPYSYYNPYSYGNGYYGGGYGGGYYPGGVTVRNNENYRPRPSRGGENGNVRGEGNIYTPGSSRSNNGDANTSNAPRTRAEMYNPTNNGTNRPTQSNGTSSTPTRSNNGSDGRPTRGNDNPPVRPTRSNDTQSRPTYTPPPAQESRPPVQSSPPPSRGENNSGRPTRGNG